MITDSVAVAVMSMAYTNMKNIRWQIPFVSLQGVHYRVDIYDEGTFTPVQLTAGPTPFVTDEDASDDFFCPVRTQTGTLQVCTLKPDGNYITLDDLLPANNIARPIRLINLDNSNAIEWQGFLSCEAYSQDYTGIPQILDLPVISVLEAMKSMPISDYWFDQMSGATISTIIHTITDQIEGDTDTQVSVDISTSSDFSSKYIFVTQFFHYESNEASGELQYVSKNAMLYDVVESLCKYIGWCLREDGVTFYFRRIGSDEVGQTTLNISDMEWRGDGHKRSLRQGAHSVTVEAKVDKFETHFDMPMCPIQGLSQKNYYSIIIGQPQWYYDKCTSTNVLNFTSYNISKAFLARFYGVRNVSTFPWNNTYEKIGFENVIAIWGQAYNDDTYARICSVRSVQNFSCVLGVANTLEDVGHFVLKIKDEVAAKLKVDGYIRCGLYFNGSYYNGSVWTGGSASSFKINLSSGSGEITVPLPKTGSVYSFTESEIIVYLYDDFDNTKTSALISEISVEYEPPFRKYTDPSDTNRYITNINNDFRDEISIEVPFASMFANVNGLSHIYGVKRYTYGQEYVDYLEPITELTYTDQNGIAVTRRPEVDLLNRLASYYGAARQRLELEVAHPTAAPLPLLKLNGIGDSKVYLPLSESRDWQTDVCKLTCFETPQ